jgi:hypothetical protein
MSNHVVRDVSYVALALARVSLASARGADTLQHEQEPERDPALSSLRMSAEALQCRRPWFPRRSSQKTSNKTTSDADTDTQWLPCAQAVRRQEHTDALRGILGRYLELLAERLTAVPADMARLPQLYAALGASSRVEL